MSKLENVLKIDGLTASDSGHRLCRVFSVGNR
jgi:hypothetical protein